MFGESWHGATECGEDASDDCVDTTPVCPHEFRSEMTGLLRVNRNSSKEERNMNLHEFVRASLKQAPCNCLSTGPDRTANIGFTHVTLEGAPDVEEFKRLIAEHKGLNGAEDVNPLGEEAVHDYTVIGAWIGSQALAFYFIGLGDLLGLWHCYHHNTVALVSNKVWAEATAAAARSDD